MCLLDAVIFRYLIKRYGLAQLGKDLDLCGSDCLDVLNLMLRSANETIRESETDYRELINLTDQARDLFAESVAIGG